jgi:hypothetical protein
MAESDDRRTCYVIAPIGEKGSTIRKRSDQVLKHLISPALSGFDYDIRRSDKDSEPGEIPGQIIDQMASAELVVADLTEHNPNVFYELAVRHVAAKPLVQIIQAGQDIPFDVGQMRTVYFNLADPDELEDARNELVKHVDALQNVSEIETPVKASLRLKQALESSDPATAGNAEILAALQAMRHDIERVRTNQGRYSNSSFVPSQPMAFYPGGTPADAESMVVRPIKTTELFATQSFSPVEAFSPAEEPASADPPAEAPDEPSVDEGA